MISYSIDYRGGAVLIRLGDEFDPGDAGTFEYFIRCLVAERPELVHIDLSDITSMDSIGLRLLLDAQRELAEVDVPIGITRGDGAAARLFELAGITDEFEVLPR